MEFMTDTSEPQHFLKKSVARVDIQTIQHAIPK